MMRSLAKLTRSFPAPLLLQESANASTIQTRHCVYSNAIGSCAIACPADVGTHIVADISDTHFFPVVMAGGITMVSGYLQAHQIMYSLQRLTPSVLA